MVTNREREYILDTIDDLVSPWLSEVARVNGKTLTIINADAMTWKPPKGQRYDVSWHDIWDNLCGDNLPSMHKLHRRYGRICDWQASWARELVEHHERMEKRQLRRWGT